MKPFKIGQKVRVRDDLVIGEPYMHYNGAFNGFVSSMSHLSGKVVTITYDSAYGYSVIESGYELTHEMLTNVTNIKLGILKII